MRTEKAIHDYYDRRIKKIHIPPVPDYIDEHLVHPKSGRFVTLAFAAALAFSFIPFFYYAGTPSELTVRAAEFSREYELGTRISAGIINIQRIAHHSSLSGGKR